MYLRYRQKLIIGVTLIVVACLILSSIFVYYAYFKEEEETIKEEPEDASEYDLDAISPLENQGLNFEVLRIRHRGLLDEIMQRGTSWKKKPQFYFITNIDGVEFISKNVHAPGGESEELFTTWDTIFQERKVKHDAEEEQEKSEITLKIIEREKIGILGLRSQDNEIDKIDLTFDYKTGRWEGDDSFNDSDGYGHYLGDMYEIWFNIVPNDDDRDGIPYWTEVNILNTNPEIDDSKLDPDEDGIPTAWEWKWGYDAENDVMIYDPHVYDNHSTLDPDNDGLENVEEYQMAKWFANPFSQDIYIEVDGMEKGGLFDKTHVFWTESQQIMIERFASHGINLYIDDGWPGGPINGGGEILPYIETISQDSGATSPFYRNHFAEERRGIFRYLIVGNAAGFCHPSEFNRYDTMAVGTNLQIFLKRGGFTPRAFRVMLAAMVMHETGHSLGIGPWNVGGNDNASFVESKEAEREYVEKWGNYRSVMNYYHMYDKKMVDYSDGSNGLGDVNDWEMFDLTYFQQEAKVVEGPDFELPGVEEIGLIKYMIMQSKLRRYGIV